MPPLTFAGGIISLVIAEVVAVGGEALLVGAEWPFWIDDDEALVELS